MGNKATLYLSDDDKTSLRDLAAALELFSKPSGGQAGSISGLLTALAASYRAHPKPTYEALSILFDREANDTPSIE